MNVRRKPHYELRLIRLGILSYLGIILLTGLMFFSIHNNGSFFDYSIIVLKSGGTLFTLGLFLFMGVGGWRVQKLPPGDAILIVRDAFADKFFAILVSCLSVSITGYIALNALFQMGYASMASFPVTGNIRNELHILMEKAQEWQSDAYLIEIELHLYEFYPGRTIIAHYRSLSRPDMKLHITLMNTGEYKFKEYDLGPQDWDYMRGPILDEDWEIDSNQAIDVFLKDDDLRYCLMLSGNDLRKLSLYRLYPEENLVIWHLQFNACLTFEGDSVIINAKTGEIIPSTFNYRFP